MLDYKGMLGDNILEDLVPLGLETANSVYAEYFDYDKNDRLVHAIDSNGTEKWSIYNELGNIVKKFHVDKGKVRRTIGYIYTAEHKLTQVVDSKLGLSTYTYEGNTTTVVSSKPNSETITTSVTDDLGNELECHEETRSLFDKATIYKNSCVKEYEDGKLMCITEEHTAARISRKQTWFEYDDDGHCVKSYDDTGNTTTYKYDEEGREVEVISPIMKKTSTYYKDLGAARRVIVSGEITTEYWELYGQPTSGNRPLLICRIRIVR